LPKLVDKIKKRREIALAALDVFAEDGFEGASVSKIADLANIGKGTVYEYFETKEEIFLTALEAWSDLLSCDMQRAIEAISEPTEKLRVLMRNSMTPIMKDPRIMGLIVSMMPLIQKNKEFLIKSELYQQTHGSTEKMIVRILQQGVKAGAFRPETAKYADRHAVNLVAFLHGLWAHGYIEQRAFDIFEQMDFFMDMFFKSIQNPSNVETAKITERKRRISHDN